jgi:hypothetical protein
MDAANGTENHECKAESNGKRKQESASHGNSPHPAGNEGTAQGTLREKFQFILAKVVTEEGDEHSLRKFTSGERTRFGDAFLKAVVTFLTIA